MTRRAQYSIAHISETYVAIRDSCTPGCLSLTNDIERVVAELVSRGTLLPTQRLYYYDSEGDLSRVEVKEGKFVRFL